MVRGYFGPKKVRNQLGSVRSPDATAWEGFEDTPVGKGRRSGTGEATGAPAPEASLPVSQPPISRGAESSHLHREDSRGSLGTAVKLTEARFVRVAEADFYDGLGRAIMEAGMGDAIRYLPHAADVNSRPVVSIWDAARQLDLPKASHLRQAMIPKDPALIMPKSAPGWKTFQRTLTPVVAGLRVQTHNPTKAGVQRNVLRVLFTPLDDPEGLNPGLQDLITAEREGMYTGIARGDSREVRPRPVCVNLAIACGEAAIHALKEVHRTLHDEIVGQPMMLDLVSFAPRIIDPRV